jgi:dynein light intermediate chain 1
MALNNRVSTYTQSSDHDRPKSSDAKKDMWSSMLDSVASGKKLPVKNILVLGELSGCRRNVILMIM